VKNRHTLVAVSLISLALGQSVWAASSGNLTLSGSVAVVNDISITANGSNNTTLNIVAGETAKNVAAVDETSNNAAGYKIYMYSTNAGELRHSVDPLKKTTYTISYGGGSYGAPPLSASPVQVKNVSSLAGLATATSQVLITVVAYPTAIAGSYSDTLTLSIVAN
jgi:hypothetical protein